ncbi:MAG: hypothetical protein KDK72_03080 [Chlamydiia bacterium]|nr:hypothetical protein [Chlamydiia bacterium]
MSPLNNILCCNTSDFLEAVDNCKNHSLLLDLFEASRNNATWFSQAPITEDLPEIISKHINGRCFTQTDLGRILAVAKELLPNTLTITLSDGEYPYNESLFNKTFPNVDIKTLEKLTIDEFKLLLKGLIADEGKKFFASDVREILTIATKIDMRPFPKAIWNNTTLDKSSATKLLLLANTLECSSLAEDCIAMLNKKNSNSHCYEYDENRKITAMTLSLNCADEDILNEFKALIPACFSKNYAIRIKESALENAPLLANILECAAEKCPPKAMIIEFNDAGQYLSIETIETILHGIGKNTEISWSTTKTNITSLDIQGWCNLGYKFGTVYTTLSSEEILKELSNPASSISENKIATSALDGD